MMCLMIEVGSYSKQPFMANVKQKDLLTLVRHKESDDCDYDRKLLKNMNKLLEYDWNKPTKVSSYHISFKIEL